MNILFDKCTSLKNLKSLYIECYDDERFIYEEGEGVGFFKLNSCCINIYEYEHYWKVITFIRGNGKGISVEVIPKNRIKNMSYQL